MIIISNISISVSIEVVVVVGRSRSYILQSATMCNASGRSDVPSAVSEVMFT